MKTQQHGRLINKLTGAAAKAKREADESDQYYMMILQCFNMAFEDATY